MGRRGTNIFFLFLIRAMNGMTNVKSIVWIMIPQRISLLLVAFALQPSSLVQSHEARFQHQAADTTLTAPDSG